eukprot:TRINITY_DN8173_c0_g1_i1.p1 TRINITY_DN8173_c0_g1~~TRINITY_DN8173_c0_g1_i1.p1  ORF type:complete len:354 (-),score=78.68 TRINITY_DN8173_c0_g1_i1:179-1240(-)
MLSRPLDGCCCEHETTAGHVVSVIIEKAQHLAQLPHEFGRQTSPEQQQQQQQPADVAATRAAAPLAQVLRGPIIGSKHLPLIATAAAAADAEAPKRPPRALLEPSLHLWDDHESGEGGAQLLSAWPAGSTSASSSSNPDLPPLPPPAEAPPPDSEAGRRVQFDASGSQVQAPAASPQNFLVWGPSQFDSRRPSRSPLRVKHTGMAPPAYLQEVTASSQQARTAQQQQQAPPSPSQQGQPQPPLSPSQSQQLARPALVKQHSEVWIAALAATPPAPLTDLANGVRSGVNELSGGLAWLSSALTAVTGECANANVLETVKDRFTNANILDSIKDRCTNAKAPDTDGESTRSSTLA